MKERIISRPLRTTFIYAIFGALWILLSDSILILVIPQTSQAYPLAQTLKGWFFILVSALLLYFVLMRDARTLREHEEGQRVSERMYRELFQSNPQPMWVYDMETLKFLMVNEAAITHYGYTHEEFLNMTIKDIRPAEQLPNLLANLAQPPQDLEKSSGWMHRKRDGTLIDVEISSHLINREGRSARMVLVNDVTQRKQAEEALRISEENYRNLAETSDSAIAVLDQDGRILYANPASLRIWQDPHLISRTVHELFPEEVAEGYLKVVRHVIHDQIVDQNELQTRVKGKVMWFHISMMPLKNSEGTVNALLLNAWDLTERKQAEEALHASELRFRALIEHGQDNISLLDAEGTLLWENPSATRMLGYSPDEFKGRNIFDLVHPDDLKQVQAQFAEILAKPGSEGNGSFRLKHANGTWRWAEGIGTNLLHEPSVNAIVINYRDITERKQAEETQRQSEILFFKVFRASPIGINIFRLSDGRSYNTNDAFLEIVGYSREEIINHAAAELDLFVDVEAQNALMEKLREGRSVRNQDVKIRRKSGQIRDCLASFDIIEIGGESMVLVIAADITERKQTEDLLKQSEERYRSTLDSMLEGIQIIDYEWRYAYVNEAVARQGQSTREELLGRTMMESYPGIEYTELFAILRDCMENRTVRRFENEFHFPNGSSGWFELNVQPRPEGIFILSIDISERKKAEEQLRRSEERFRLMAENIEEGFWITDPNSQNEVYLSPEVARIFGHSVNELMQSPVAFLEAVLPEDLSLVQANLEKQKHGAATNMEYRIRHTDGSVRWIWDRAFPVLKEDGTVNIVTGLITDITERKKTEARIQTQLKRLNALSAIDSAISTSMDMRLTLDVFLRETITQLNVDAADILLYNSSLQALEYALGYGFRSKGWGEVSLHLDEGLAGRVMQERQRVYVPDLEKVENKFTRLSLSINEGFVTYFGVPLIAKGQVKGVLEIFQRSPLNPDAEWLDYLMTLAGQAGIAIDNAQLFEGLQRSNQELSMAYDATIAGWSHAMDLRDKETEGHTQRVTELTLQLAERMDIPPQEMVHIRRGALLHDIGKLGVPDQILFKPGKLTKDEWVVMRKHPTYAHDMLISINYLRHALDIPYCHHEKWDGTGYPRGLKGEEIPLSARLFAVVDVWDALRSDRPYRDGWTIPKARDYIQAETGHHFDPQVVDIFIRFLDEEKNLQ